MKSSRTLARSRESSRLDGTLVSNLTRDEGYQGMPETLFEKVWNRHVVKAAGDSTLLYIDRHLVHEVTSPQAFDGLRLAGRRVRRPELTFATVDHNVPTENQLDIREPL